MRAVYETIEELQAMIDHIDHLIDNMPPEPPFTVTIEETTMTLPGVIDQLAALMTGDDT